MTRAIKHQGLRGSGMKSNARQTCHLLNKLSIHTGCENSLLLRTSKIPSISNNVPHSCQNNKTLIERARAGNTSRLQMTATFCGGFSFFFLHLSIFSLWTCGGVEKAKERSTDRRGAEWSTGGVEADGEGSRSLWVHSLHNTDYNPEIYQTNSSLARALKTPLTICFCCHSPSFKVGCSGASALSLAGRRLCVYLSGRKTKEPWGLSIWTANSYCFFTSVYYLDPSVYLQNRYREITKTVGEKSSASVKEFRRVLLRH